MKTDQLNKLYKVDAFFNTSLAYNLFNDFVSDLESNNTALLFYDRRGGIDYIVFSNELDSGFYTTEDLDKLDDLDLLFICETLGIYEEEIEDEIEAVLSLTVADYYSFLHKEKHWHDLDYDYDYKLIGYSQGDVIKILDLTKGQKYSTEEYKKYLHSIFYDSPVSIVIEDNQGGIIYLDEYLNLSYEYDKDKIILDFENTPKEYRLRDHDLILDALKLMLPKELEYK